MAETAVLIATGTDRPGILDELSQFLLECHGNVTDIRSINLQGQFALLLQVQAEPGAMAVIRSGLPNLKSSGISVELRQAATGAGNVPNESSTFPYVFTAGGKDQAGVLHRISHLLRVLNVNIDDIQTRLNPEGTFQMRLALSVPRQAPISMVRDYLSYLCKEINVSGELKEA